jgi:hypothetical protein
MSRKKEVLELFDFLIELLKDKTTEVEIKQDNKLLVEQTTSGLFKPSDVVDLIKRVDEIDKNMSVTKAVSGLRDKVGEINAKLREKEEEILKKEKELDEQSNDLSDDKLLRLFKEPQVQASTAD